jgi:hypothetical protein
MTPIAARFLMALGATLALALVPLHVPGSRLQILFPRAGPSIADPPR